MALPIRPNSGAQPGSKPAAVRRASPKPSVNEEFSLPALDDLSSLKPPAKRKPANRPQMKKSTPVAATSKPVKQLESELEDGWAIDKKTGEKYKLIPKSVYKGKGKNAVPELAIEDFDVDDMTGEAETYLSHLRVPPDKEEQERLKKLRIQLKKRSDAEYEAMNRDEIEKEESVDSNVLVPTNKEKKSLIQKLAGLFR